MIRLWIWVPFYANEIINDDSSKCIASRFSYEPIASIHYSFMRLQHLNKVSGEGSNSEIARHSLFWITLWVFWRKCLFSPLKRKLCWWKRKIKTSGISPNILHYHIIFFRATMYIFKYVNIYWQSTIDILRKE